MDKKIDKKSEKEMSAIDKILSTECTEDIILYDESNKEATFEQVAIIPIDEKIYAVLKPVTKIEGVNDDEALVFVIEELDDEDCLIIVDDEDIVDKVFEEYYELLREEGIDIN